LIPTKIERIHVIKAIKEIDSNGIPQGRESRRFLLSFGGKEYPPKYILSLANRYINGKELNPSKFSGGQETNTFLRSLGFVVREISSANPKSIKSIKHEKTSKKIKSNWVATVLLRSNERFGQTDNDIRKKVLENILNETLRRTRGDGVILFPGGYLNSGKKKANAIFNFATNHLKEELRKVKRNIIVCFGIDGRLGRGYPKDFPKDQLAIAVSRKGIIAIGRKFNPTEDEEGKISSASTYQSLENRKFRIFSLNGKRFYMAVCYDVFGLKQLSNPGVKVILNAIHQFTPRCKCKPKPCKCGAASGDVDFARKGLAGASREWNCPVFGSVVFFKPNIPPRWPSGVRWNQGNKSVKQWKYRNNPIKTGDEFELSIKEGVALVRIYNI
jgi:hypothetical protein